MKKIITLITLIMVYGLSFSDNLPYELMNDDKGYSFIKINENLDSFSFKSDFKSIGNSGKVGYFIYPNGLEGNDLIEYISKFDRIDPEFGKKINDGVVEINNLNINDRIGFYLVRNNGAIVKDWKFETKKNTNYIAFEKNGSGKDEWMSLDDISFEITSDDTHNISGAPLPGSLAVILVGFLLGYIPTKMKKSLSFV